jgi:hypothetical protein
MGFGSCIKFCFLSQNIKNTQVYICRIMWRELYLCDRIKWIRIVLFQNIFNGYIIAADPRRCAK